MWSSPDDHECPACGLSVPMAETADLQTPTRAVTVCLACHGRLTPGFRPASEVARD
jgi:ribosomal protein S27AE